ncbi:MAG: GNAT family N-acetyltransferase [Micromonosporaceae bacterium]
MRSIEIRAYADREHKAGVASVLAALGWEQRHVDGQLAAVAEFSGSADGSVLVAVEESVVAGYVSVGFEAWNRLGQIHGLAVLPEARRRGIAKALVEAAVQRLRSQGARGVRVDTPVDNLTGRLFYQSAGFTEDHILTRYYADDLDGVTYVRFFDM